MGGEGRGGGRRETGVGGWEALFTKKPRRGGEDDDDDYAGSLASD